MTEPVVIVGAGVAGLATALAAAPRPIRLVCRGSGGVASELAQGGLAAAIGAGDSVAAHVHDTLVAGAWHNDAARVRWLCESAADVVAWLEAQGVVFDRDADGNLELGREGGHDVHRIVHAGGDATGAEFVRALMLRARAASHIEWLDGVNVDGLVTRGGRAAGVLGRRSDGSRIEVDAAAVVLATGGSGALFARTSNPPGAQGSGLALGMAAGAAARDLEFVQFHPTALDVPGRVSLPLVTEALRGAGAHLVDSAGRAIMAGVHPQGDLAPRDVVSRRVWQVAQAGTRVLLDARAIDVDWLRRFPTVLRACLAQGLDPREAPIPVTPVAHFHMGGLAVDADGGTSVPGLYAVGEVACTGVHGANRLASNSLLEGIACGRRLGALLAEGGPYEPSGARASHAVGAGLGPERLAALRALLWSAAGPERNEAGLAAALAELESWGAEGWQAGVARAILAAARERRVNLGAHWRTDGVASTGDAAALAG